MVASVIVRPNEVERVGVSTETEGSIKAEGPVGGASALGVVSPLDRLAPPRLVSPLHATAPGEACVAGPQGLPDDLEGLLDEDAGGGDEADPTLAIPADEFLDVQLSDLDEVLTEFVLAAVEDLRVRLGAGPRPRDLVDYLVGRSRDPHVAAGPGSGVFGRIPPGGVHAMIDRLLQLDAIGYERGSKRLCLLNGAAWISKIWGGPRPRVLEALLAAPRRTPLYEALANYRRQTARGSEIPPYRILTNRVLAAIVQARPGSLRDLAAISGVGSQTLSNHGEAILALIRSAPFDPTTDADT